MRHSIHGSHTSDPRGAGRARSRAFVGLGFAAGLLLATSPPARGDDTCHVSFLDSGTFMCISEHGNVLFLGPDNGAGGVENPQNFFREGYVLCGGSGEFPIRAYDLGNTEDNFGDLDGSPSVSHRPPNPAPFQLLVEREEGTGQLRLDQLLRMDFATMRIDIDMTVTNVTNIGPSGSNVQGTAIHNITLDRRVAKQADGPRAGRTERSVMVWEPAGQYGRSLTDRTYPPLKKTTTSLVHPSLLNIGGKCAPIAAPGNRAGGQIRYRIGTLKAGQSKTVHMSYQAF